MHLKSFRSPLINLFLTKFSRNHIETTFQYWIFISNVILGHTIFFYVYNIMERLHCAICNSDSFQHIYTLADYPITPSSSRLDMTTDEFQDCTFIECMVCGCVQLKTLIDPVKLYQNFNKMIDTTPTWKEHHRLFSIFVLENNTHNTILEIGGSSGPLYKLLSDTGINYIIMDIADSEKRPTEVQFIQGNCENFDFTGYKSVVLSHTFEHLYFPRKFVENLCKASVESVFISIPNVDHLYESENISILHNEHTFYIGNNEIQYLFSHFGYSCVKSYNFRTHSLFYHFVRDNNTVHYALNLNIERGNHMREIFIKYETRMKDIDISTPCFICPGAHYGQKIYYYLRRFSNHIQGFIDNDPLKQGRRVYGTPSYVYSPDILAKYKGTTICLILYAGPYTEELKRQLDMIHPSIKYIAI